MIEQVIAAAGGVCRTSDLTRAGYTAFAIRQALATNRLLRLRQGIYCIDGSHPAADAARHGGTMACASAVRAYGVWLLDDAKRLHVGVQLRGRTHPHFGCSCIAHRSRHNQEFGVVPLRVALVQVARCLGEETFFAALESALYLRLITREDRGWIRSHVTSALAALVDFARTNAESGLESLVRLRLFRLGIAARSQVRIATVGRVDLAIGNVAIELDGRENHDGPSQRHKDLVRDARAARRGWRTLRFDYAMVVYEWELVRDAILAVI